MKNTKKIFAACSFALLLSLAMSSCQSNKGSGCGYWGYDTPLENKLDKTQPHDNERQVYHKYAKTS